MAPPAETAVGSEEPRPTFSIERHDRAGGVVLSLRGELDLSSADRLLAAAAAADPSPGGRLVLDLAELDFIDSAGLRSLMNLDLRARTEGWDFGLAAPAPAVRRLLKLTGFDKRLAISDRAP